MRQYSQDDEEKIRAQALVREWRRSGLLDVAQSAHLETSLHVDLRRTNFFFRALLFLFGAIIVLASVWLTNPFELTDKLAQAAVCVVMAVVCFVVGELLVARLHFYRFGIEESLLCASAVLLSVAVGLVLNSHEVAAGLAVGAICGVLLFQIFGYVYAAIGGAICAAMLPFAADLSGETERLLAALIFAVVFVIVRSRRISLDDDFPGDDYGLIQAAAWAGIYCTLNLQLSYSHFGGTFYWFTYAMTWVLPIVGLSLSIPKKDRILLNLSVVMLLTTLVTNKPYLGLTRKPWDPILFGLLLIGSALIIKRLLSKGQRYGFTAARLLAGDKRILDMVATASAVMQPKAPAHDTTARPEFGGGGGRSGGAGASGEF